MRWLGGGREASCRQVMRVLQAFLDGHADEQTALRVARHLEDCRRCGLEASVYRDIKNALRRQRAEVPSAALARLGDFAGHLVTGPDKPDPGRGDH